ncbi:sensor histidine kinase [Actinomadura rupiterrae]|uniref:sensor histidine kinase n=1 Tax=Actinomadura rupiterrae TaxID=559627 RepID=UPI0020A41C9D|nr:sensor histidine kinase [Actinomadura rupiterrae]MCP2341105.1 signal transduction histidine kinase [Actinomadura rupiterrae]
MGVIGKLRVPRGDAVFAAVAAAVVLAVPAIRDTDGERALWPGGGLLILAGTLSLAVRRRFPVTVLVVVTAAVMLYYPLGYPNGAIALVFPIALFTVAAERRLWVALSIAGVVEAVAVGAGLVRGRRLMDDNALAWLSLGLLITVWLGYYVRGRRARMEEAELRAAEAERTREQEAVQRAVQERLRIARELHDVLAHQISLINVQAGAALHRREEPAQAYAALEAIKQASRETLRELRTALGVLRQVDEEVAVAPAPSLARVDELLDQVVAAGLAVRLDGRDAASGLPVEVDLAGYRIVQEAVTNAVRHARARTVAVRIERADGMLVVQVDDDGRGPVGEGSGGHGLRGMRERAASIGGEVAAGPGPDGGFRVRARLPLAGRDGGIA